MMSMGAAETRKAIEAADTALPDWRAKTAKERAQILRKWFELMMANQDDLGQLMTMEQGKPLAEAKGEIVSAAPIFGTLPIASPVAGLTTSTVAPLSASTHFPPM